MRIGDRVRCTLGESVIVGQYEGDNGMGWLNIEVEGTYVKVPPSWNVEVLPPPERRWEPGDVVRDAIGFLFLRDEGFWRYGGPTGACDEPVRPLTWLAPEGRS